jgi:ParB family chromosome partitioning protein
MAQQHGLGRGLSSLIPQKKDQDNTDAQSLVSGRSFATRQTTSQSVLQRDDHSRRDNAVETPTAKKDSEREMAVRGIAIQEIIANSHQPRMYFDEEKLAELAASIKAHGVLQPLVVLKKGAQYELVAGERRLRAAKKAGLTHVPAIVRGAMDDQKKLELAIIENVQRHDLNVIEEAKSYKRLADEFSLSQEEIAQRTGKSRSVVANRMRLAKLPIDIQRGLIDGKISEGHAKIILSLDNPEKQRALYDMILSEKLSVRDTEQRASSSGSMTTTHRKSAYAKTPQERVLEDQLTAYFGTRVGVKQKNKGGAITINYFSSEELKGILSKLKL